MKKISEFEENIDQFSVRCNLILNIKMLVIGVKITDLKNEK